MEVPWIMEWFEDDAFWRDLYPYFFPSERFATAGEQVAQLLALTGSTGGAVLDLCCGPGRHSVELARRGFTVTGVDRSAFLLDRARERAYESGVPVEWVAEDMRDFCRPAAFQLVCNIYTSFGYFEKEEDDLKVLRNVHASLADGGVLVMEMMGKERLARNWQDGQNAICTDYPDGATVIARPRLCDDWCRVEIEWILVKDGRARTFHFAHNLYSGRELKDRLLASGFGEVQLYGDLQGLPYGPSTTRLVAVARKAPILRTSE